MPHRPIKPTLPQHIVRQPVVPTIPQPIADRQPDPTVRPRPAGDANAGRDKQSTSVRPFRPIVRPPLAFLEILDDGEETGELVRLRNDATTIGRTDADVLIPHDHQVSGTHCKISRRLQDGVFQWFLTDLNSSNGTFVRVAKAPLVDGQLFLIGSFRYQFRVGDAVEFPTSDASAVPHGTRGWQVAVVADLAGRSPSLVRLNPDGTETPFRITGDAAAIGQSPQQCQILVTDDPAIGEVQARIQKSPDGRYVIEDAKSLNGTWLAVQEHRVSRMAQFQIGEQRFRLKVQS